MQQQASPAFRDPMPPKGALGYLSVNRTTGQQQIRIKLPNATQEAFQEFWAFMQAHAAEGINLDLVPVKGKLGQFSPDFFVNPRIQKPKTAFIPRQPYQQQPAQQAYMQPQTAAAPQFVAPPVTAAVINTLGAPRFELQSVIAAPSQAYMQPLNVPSGQLPPLASIPLQ